MAWLRGARPRAPDSRDEWSLEAELARREGRSPFQVGLAHHADLCLSALYLALRIGPWRARVRLPLPLPSAWGRRWAWGRRSLAAEDPGQEGLTEERKEQEGSSRQGEGEHDLRAALRDEVAQAPDQDQGQER